MIATRFRATSHSESGFVLMRLARSKPGLFLAMGLLAVLLFERKVHAEEGAKEEATGLPNIYFDLSTDYAVTPANTLATGFGGFRRLSTTSSQGLTFNAPLTVDLNDWLTIYGGVTAATFKTASTSWAPITLASWNTGFFAEVVQQGAFTPKVSVQSTFSRTIDSSSVGLSASSLSTVVESGYALDEDETRGLLAGVRYTRVWVEANLIRVQPAIVGYVGGYYQWSNNWKLTGRAGIQSFGGAQIANLVHLDSFLKPIVRIDLDRLDDNSNRLFGLALEVAWTPNPGFQMTLSTPLYFVRN